MTRPFWANDSLQKGKRRGVLDVKEIVPGKKSLFTPNVRCLPILPFVITCSSIGLLRRLSMLTICKSSLYPSRRRMCMLCVCLCVCLCVSIVIPHYHGTITLKLCCIQLKDMNLFPLSSGASVQAGERMSAASRGARSKQFAACK